ncbi:hypothetical protein Hesp01_74140 [Herbidospora sp. NBRC 101105]|nr:hypothetical protein Hesp01_74140 [Herbidospora sp. NBRC 101105]
MAPPAPPRRWRVALDGIVYVLTRDVPRAGLRLVFGEELDDRGQSRPVTAGPSAGNPLSPAG